MRECGTLMHITSLPGPYGVGTMGASAYAFVDFLRNAGQSCWQILPLTPTGYGDSPYQSCSTFAGNPYLIDLELLIQQGLLTEADVDGITWCDTQQKVNFGILYRHRLAVLRRAFERFTPTQEFDDFCSENSSWLSDFALFLAIKEQQGGKAWYQWEDDLKYRQPEAIWQVRQSLRPEIRFYSFVQYLFFCQWNALHAYARENGIRIIGDVPIYVPYDSVEVWSSPELFQLDKSLVPTDVAGVPPDGFTADGQLWGNPLYRWEEHKKDGYSWWLRRMAAAGKLYDTVRFDHFRGLESYWAVPYGDLTARNGKWVKGPGIDLINAIKKGLPELKLIAEDLGYLTEEVLAMLDEAGFPGMKVLQFAFDSRETSDYRPHTYPVNSVCYSGTHDNLPLGQWFDEADPADIQMAKDYLGLNKEEGYIKGMIRGCMSSVSKLCIIQIQDYLELGGYARMNFPGTLSSANWTWRALPGFLTEELKQRIFTTTQRYGRL